MSARAMLPLLFHQPLAINRQPYPISICYSQSTLYSSARHLSCHRHNTDVAFIIQSHTRPSSICILVHDQCPPIRAQTSFSLWPDSDVVLVEWQDNGWRMAATSVDNGGAGDGMTELFFVLVIWLIATTSGYQRIFVARVCEEIRTVGWWTMVGYVTYVRRMTRKMMWNWLTALPRPSDLSSAYMACVP